MMVGMTRREEVPGDGLPRDLGRIVLVFACLGRLLAASISTLLTYFRAIHRLAGRPVPGNDLELLRSTGEMVGFDETPVARVLEMKRTGKAPSTTIRGELAEGFLTVVEKATRWLDAYEPVEGLSPDL